jgi:hypothetical protein
VWGSVSEQCPVMHADALGFDGKDREAVHAARRAASLAVQSLCVVEAEFAHAGIDSVVEFLNYGSRIALFHGSNLGVRANPRSAVR